MHQSALFPNSLYFCIDLLGVQTVFVLKTNDGVVHFDRVIQVIVWNSDWYITLFPSVVIGRSNKNFSLVLVL